MERDYNVLYTYITKRVYPSDFDVYKKRSLRRKAEQYDVDNGELIYLGGKKGEKRRVIKNEDEKSGFWKAAMQIQKVFNCMSIIATMHYGYITTSLVHFI